MWAIYDGQMSVVQSYIRKTKKARGHYRRIYISSFWRISLKAREMHQSVPERLRLKSFKKKKRKRNAAYPRVLLNGCARESLHRGKGRGWYVGKKSGKWCGMQARAILLLIREEGARGWESRREKERGKVTAEGGLKFEIFLRLPWRRLAVTAERRGR